MAKESTFRDAQLVYTSKLDYLPPADVLDVSTDYVETATYRPINSINSDWSVIEVDIPSSETCFYDLSALDLHARLKIVNKDETKIANDFVCGANNFLHSLWRNIVITFNDKIVYGAENHYSYTAYLQQLLDRDESDLSAGYHIESTNGEPINNEVKERRNAFVGSEELELAGKVLCDLTSLRRLIPNKVAIKLRFEANPTAFSLLAPENNKPVMGPDPKDATKQIIASWETYKDYKLVLTDFYVSLPKVLLSPSVHSSVMSIINNGTTALNVKQTVVKTIAVPANSYNMSMDRIFMGRLPKTVLITFVDAEAYRGGIEKSPFNFKHMNMTKLVCSVDESMSVTKTQTFNFENNNYLAGFLNFSRAVNLKSQKAINRQRWAMGKTIFGFDFSNNLDDLFKTPQQTGSLRLEATFGKATTSAMICLVYGMYDSKLYMDSDRNFSY